VTIVVHGGLGLRRRVLVAGVLGAAAAVMTSVSVAEAESSGRPRDLIRRVRHPLVPRARPLVIAHRGASAYRPEHTIDAYRMAIEQGADYIEADLVVTADGHLVARHENQLSWTTDVAEHKEFAKRRRTKTVEGVSSTNWFAEDFTLAELKTLRARPRTPLPNVPPEPVGSIPSLQDMIDLAFESPVGLYLELKIPSYFAALQLSPEPILVSTLSRNGLPSRHVPVFVESFEGPSLQGVHAEFAVPLIQLISGPVPADLEPIHRYATGIGVDKSQVTPALVERAHAERLEVHAFTFANATPADYRTYLAMGVDGVFTDNPDVARRAVRSARAG
jgi:glycerophosphoryl diester phosphodiesterase